MGALKARLIHSSLSEFWSEHFLLDEAILTKNSFAVKINRTSVLHNLISPSLPPSLPPPPKYINVVALKLQIAFAFVADIYQYLQRNYGFEIFSN